MPTVPTRPVDMGVASSGGQPVVGVAAATLAHAGVLAHGPTRDALRLRPAGDRTRERAWRSVGRGARDQRHAARDRLVTGTGGWPLRTPGSWRGLSGWAPCRRPPPSHRGKH
jgi:hypothetical protein